MDTSTHALTVGKVLTTTVFQINLAFVRNHSQSQAMLTFVTAFEWTTLTAPKSMHILENSQLVFGRGSSQVEACIASPISCPYVSKQLMGMFYI